MNHDDALRIDWLCEQYLQAIETQDFASQEKLWERAAHDAQLLQAFRELNEGLLEEAEQKDDANTDVQIEAMVKAHMPSATVIQSPARLSVAEVSRALAQQLPGQQQPAIAALLTKLNASIESIPEVKGLTSLTQWAEAHFGKAPPGFWRVFQQAALKLEMQQAATSHYALAARPAPRHEG
jgi:hypothetical protein